MPTLTHDRPRTFARQLRQLAADLAAGGCRLTPEAREELGLEPGREPALTAAGPTEPQREDDAYDDHRGVAVR